jgi:hypothetical protein
MVSTLFYITLSHLRVLGLFKFLFLFLKGHATRS